MKNEKSKSVYACRGFNNIGYNRSNCLFNCANINTKIAREGDNCCFKKTFATLSQAYKMAEQANGPVEGWTMTAEAYAVSMLPFLKVAKNCERAQGCFPDVDYTFLWNAYTPENFSRSTYYKFVLSDGSLAIINIYNTVNPMSDNQPALKEVVGEIWVDVNGAKEPNERGRDFFSFYITAKQGIWPMGTQQDWESFDNACQLRVDGDGGYACAAWVIYNENMDYLRCDDLAWDGKTKCD